MSDHRIGGINFGEALQISFIILKLCKVIDWSWEWVLAPTWVPIALAVIKVVVDKIRRKA